MTKTCKTCKQTKPVEEFRKDATNISDGRRAHCKSCISKPRDRRFLGVEQTDQGTLPAIPEGFHVKGVSTLTDEEGNVKGQWVKSFQSAEAREEKLLDAIREVFADPQTPKFEDAPPTGELDEDLCCIYPMGDPHLGMFSWAQETGDDFDLKIAEADLMAAVDSLVASAPAATHALFANLGDYFHSDNSENRTARSGHSLDVDSRWAKVQGVGLKLMKRLIERALEKHQFVHVINEIGNHDDHGAVMLSLALALFFEGNPRVTIDTSPAKYHWYRFGKNLVGITHGDTVKIQDLPAIMAADRPQDWGETEHRFWLTGHVHHSRKLAQTDLVGASVESFRTLAPKDAWHASKGYRSQQDMKCIVLHKEWGEIGRNQIGIRQIRAKRKSK